MPEAIIHPELGKPKQVCILRQMYPNPENPGVLRKLRTGKYVAQAGHAYQVAEWKATANTEKVAREATERGDHIITDRSALAHRDWMKGSIAKVCLYVKTEEELLELWAKIKASGLPCALIQDSGLTEFDGQKTYTAIGIGPAYDADLKPLTGHLPLF